MKGIETGQDKVRKICDVLRKETLEPAQQEAENILEKAREKAERILQEAQAEAKKVLSEARSEEEKQRNIFQSSLNQACRQTVSALKQAIEEKLFNQELGAVLSKHMQEPAVLAKITSAIVTALEKEGANGNLSIYIPAAVSAKEVNGLLTERVLSALKEKSVLLSSITGGIEVKVHKDNMIIDISDAAVKEIIGRYIRKDFRETLFGAV